MKDFMNIKTSEFYIETDEILSSLLVSDQRFRTFRGTCIEAHPCSGCDENTEHQSFHVVSSHRKTHGSLTCSVDLYSSREALRQGVQRIDGEVNTVRVSGFLVAGLAVACSIPVHAQDGYSILAWGSNAFGQCNVPEPNESFVDLSGGSGHTLGLKADGAVLAWGVNADGQCNVPAPNEGFVAVAAGSYHSLGLREDGSIEAWGWSAHGQCDVPEPNEGFVAVSAGFSHSLGLRGDGSVLAWGGNGSGQCDVPDTGPFIAIAAGAYYCLGLLETGSLVAWGGNYYGQIEIPQPNMGFVAVATGHSHSLALREDGSIVAWGRNNYGQCNVPEPNTGYTAAAGGERHSLALKEDGSVAAWGSNSSGQCNVPEPNEGFEAVAAGWLHSLGLSEPGVSIEGVCAPAVVQRLGLLSIAPNPFDSHTTLAFSSPGLASVTLEVFDLSGRRIHRQETSAFSPGQYTLIWNGTGLRGEPLPEGMYLIRLSGGGEASTTRVVLIR
jgi:hypothetical protein